MIVQARRFLEAEVPGRLRRFLPTSQRFFAPEKQYEVHSVAVFDGVAFVQIVDDLGLPNWYPEWAFDVTDSTMPSDWICNAFRNPDSVGLALVLGPEFVARNEQSYTSMVELEATSVDLFWKRVDSRKNEEVTPTNENQKPRRGAP